MINTLKIVIILLTISVVFALLGFVIGYNTPQMQAVFTQINATQGYAVNMTNAFNNTNNYFNQNNTGFLAPIENVLSFIGNLALQIRYSTLQFLCAYRLCIVSCFYYNIYCYASNF